MSALDSGQFHAAALELLRRDLIVLKANATERSDGGIPTLVVDDESDRIRLAASRITAKAPTVAPVRRSWTRFVLVAVTAWVGMHALKAACQYQVNVAHASAAIMEIVK